MKFKLPSLLSIVLILTVTLTGCLNPSASESKNADLKSLTLDSGTLTPAFDPAVTDYTVSMANSVTAITVTAAADDSKASVALSPAQPATLNLGANTITVTVTAESGAKKAYTIIVSRGRETTLSLDKETATFDSNSSVIITATAKKSDGADDTITVTSSDTTIATVSVSGLIVTITGIKAGTSIITITSGSGISKTCTVTVNASWKSIFFDDFNRTNTTKNDLGTDWTVDENFSSHGVGDIHIVNNEIVVLSGAPVAMYSKNSTLDAANTRITLKIKMSDITSGFQIHSRMATGCYLVQYNAQSGVSYKLSINKFNGTTVSMLSEIACPLLADTTYIVEFICNGSSLICNLSNTTGTVLYTLSTTDASYSAGIVAFLGETNMFFDDYRLEIFE